MITRSTVEAFDPIDDVELRPRTRLITDPMDPFDFKSLEEALHRGIVPAVGSPAHRLNHFVVFDQFVVTDAGVLAAAVGMVVSVGNKVLVRVVYERKTDRHTLQKASRVPEANA